MRKLIVYGLAGITSLALFSAVWSWYHPKTVEIPGPTVYRDVTKYVTVKVPVKIQGGSVQAVPDKPGSPAVMPIEGKNEPVIATGSVPASSGGYEIKTTISTTTGEASILALPKQRPLFSFEDSKEIGARYNGLQGGVFGRWTFVRVGSFYGSLYAEANTRPYAFAGAEVSYRW